MRKPEETYSIRLTGWVAFRATEHDDGSTWLWFYDRSALETLKIEVDAALKALAVS